nr:hypothetical protein BgiMline_026857 [Biomphalaria glabrata]
MTEKQNSVMDTSTNWNISTKWDKTQLLNNSKLESSDSQCTEQDSLLAHEDKATTNHGSMERYQNGLDQRTVSTTSMYLQVPEPRVQHTLLSFSDIVEVDEMEAESKPLVSGKLIPLASMPPSSQFHTQTLAFSNTSTEEKCILSNCRYRKSKSRSSTRELKTKLSNWTWRQQS